MFQLAMLLRYNCRTISLPRQRFLPLRPLRILSSSNSNTNHSNNLTSSSSPLFRAYKEDSADIREVIQNKVSFASRRALFASLFMYYSWYHPSRYLSACALGDSSVSIEQVTPAVLPSGPLYPTEERITRLFEKNTYSVVNFFDVTLRPQLNVTVVVEEILQLYLVPKFDGRFQMVMDLEWHGISKGTNYHVIGSSLSKNPNPGQVVAQVNILALEGVQKNFEGKLVGADRTKDLAVLKVEAPYELLKPVSVGQSSSLRVGQQCLAIGNPFGFDHTLTVGVLSGLNRDMFSQISITIGGGIQTDAAINPGNSGGLLLDSRGNLIMNNTAIFTETGTSAGVGFAIPSATVTKIVPQLIQLGKVVHVGLDLELIANQLNVCNGALIVQNSCSGSAFKTGLRPTARGFAGNIILGDVIVAVDDKPVKSKAELDKVLDEYGQGDQVILEVRRGSETLEVPITLKEKST